MKGIISSSLASSVFFLASCGGVSGIECEVPYPRGGEITYSINKNELRLTSRPGAMAEVFKIDGKKLSIEGDQLIVWVPPEYREFFGVRGRTTEVSWKSCYDELPPVLEGLNFWIDPIKSNL